MVDTWYSVSYPSFVPVCVASVCVPGGFAMRQAIMPVSIQIMARNSICWSRGFIDIRIWHLFRVNDMEFNCLHYADL